MTPTSSDRRPRPTSLLLVAATIVLGLASRQDPFLAPLFGKYPGDALWAAMIVFGTAVLRPRSSTAALALFAAVVCVFVECFKLYAAPWIVAVRHTTVGHLVLGHAFSYANLVAYAVGIALAAGLDAVRCRALRR